jgi:hypothetical protein
MKYPCVKTTVLCLVTEPVRVAERGNDELVYQFDLFKLLLMLNLSPFCEEFVLPSRWDLGEYSIIYLLANNVFSADLLPGLSKGEGDVMWGCY